MPFIGSAVAKWPGLALSDIPAIFDINMIRSAQYYIRRLKFHRKRHVKTYR